jgi:hypothetical protein
VIQEFHTKFYPPTLTLSIYGTIVTYTGVKENEYRQTKMIAAFRTEYRQTNLNKIISELKNNKKLAVLQK